MTDLERLLADELASVAERAPSWSDPAGRVRTAARRRQRRQVVVLATASALTAVAGMSTRPWAGAGPSLVPAHVVPSTPPASSPSPSSEPPPPTAVAPAPPTPSASPSGAAPSSPTASPTASPPRSPSPAEEPPPAPEGPGMEIGREYRYNLYTHCGIEFAHFDGRRWRTESLNDGSGNPPPGWDNPYQPGVVVLVEQARAEFRGDNGETLTFEPTLEQPGMCK